MNTSNFRTELPTPESNQKIGLKDSIITIGSCFSDVVGAYLVDYKFDALTNPFGTVYNPISIFNLLSGRAWDDNKYVESNGSVFHYDSHSSFFSDSKDELRRKLEDVKSRVLTKLNSTDWLIITFGTSLVYKLKETQKIVANCHKVPQNTFEKYALSIKGILDAFENLYTELKKSNPSINILLTVSPVRHIKDGLQDNAVSKSKLRVVCDELQKQLEDVFYFPSYELMVDDLRDYRFFKPDMIHPNEVAEDYIWQKFQKTYFDKETRQFIEGWKKIKEAIAHRPFNIKSEAHQNFLKKTLSELRRFEHTVNIRIEEKILRDQLI